jgi:diguanylate cyclase (GGDEF)-like protein
MNPVSHTLAVPGHGHTPAGEVEANRLCALRRYDVLDTAAEQAFDDLTELASTICGTPIALISLLDENRQWFKSRQGIEVTETPREHSFCAHAIRNPGEVMQVADARCDPRFSHNPLVTGEPRIRFYAGAPLVTPDGTALGTICVIGREPRQLNETQRGALSALSRQVVAQLELRRAVAELERQALIDSLTGVWNRRAFERRLAEEWASHRRDGKPLSLLMLDIDHFKHINDDFGHPAGDLMLRQVARLAGAPLRVSDMLARHGGEEFAVILPRVGPGAACTTAERLRAAIEAGPWPYRAVTVSIGVATAFADAASDASVLVSHADEALYVAKQRGRNRVELFEAGARQAEVR